MDTLQIGPWIVKYDAQATRQRYSQIQIGDPERCGCHPCLNFAAAREELYPDEVRKVLAKLGIDYTREAEVAHTHRVRPGRHFYLGWFHCVGQVEVIGDEPIDAVHVTEDFSWSFRNGRDVAYDVFAGCALVQIDFTAEIPWVLEVQEPQ
ncbi:MAG: hypothetical protein ACYTEX_01750 [Planctomycetota bacterium]